jgi:hypothetical protein
MVADVSDPARPVRLAESLPLPGVVDGLAVAGSYAYIVSNILGDAFDPLQGLHVWSLADPDRPREVGHLGLPGARFHMDLTGHHAYVTSANGLSIIDVTDPARPVQVGAYAPWDDWPFTDGWGLSVVGNYAHVCDPTSGLHVIDVADPSRPIGVGYCPGAPYYVAIADSVAYMADSDGGFSIADVSDPRSPREVGSVDYPVIRQIAVEMPIAYVVTAETDCLYVLGVADPSQPRELGQWCSERGQLHYLGLVGSCAYVSEAESGFRILDVSVPTAPQAVGFFSF